MMRYDILTDELFYKLFISVYVKRLNFEQPQIVKHEFCLL